MWCSRFRGELTLDGALGLRYACAAEVPVEAELAVATLVANQELTVASAVTVIAWNHTVAVFFINRTSIWKKSKCWLLGTMYFLQKCIYLN